MGMSGVKCDKRKEVRIKDYKKNLAGKKGFTMPGSMKK